MFPYIHLYIYMSFCSKQEQVGLRRHFLPFRFVVPLVDAFVERCGFSMYDATFEVV